MSDNEIDTLIDQAKDNTEKSLKKFNSDENGNDVPVSTIGQNEDELPQEFVDRQLEIIDHMATVMETKKPRAKRMKKIKAKKRTLQEFKNWLEGLQEFQPENWVPTSDQWEHIKASIAAIKEQDIITTEISSIERQPSIIQSPSRQYAQPVQSSLDMAPVTHAAGNAAHIDMRNPTAITQDIDTSDGNYTSDFE